MKKIIFIIIILCISVYALQQDSNNYLSNWYFGSAGNIQLIAGKNIGQGIGQIIIGNYTTTSFNAEKGIFYIRNIPSVINLYLNGTHQNISIEVNDTLNITGNITLPSNGRLLLYNNGTLINNATASVYNMTNFTVPSYSTNITLKYEADAGYEASQLSLFVTVNNITAIQQKIPAENDSYVNTKLVYFYYNITSPLYINKCELHYGTTKDFKRRITDTTINVTGINQTFESYLDGGEYNWSVICTGNNTKQYNSGNTTFVVTIREGPGMAAGGVGDTSATFATEKLAEIEISRKIAIPAITILSKIFPDFSKNIKDNNICELGEDPLFINRADCRFTIMEFFTKDIYRLGWVSRYIFLAMMLILVYPISVPED